MTPHQDNFPWEYLRNASVRSLESFELTRLSHAANLRKEIASLVDKWVDESASAMLARWLLEHWSQLRGASESIEEEPLDPEPKPLRKPSTALAPAPHTRTAAPG
jgi:hypothetical protein